MQDGPEDGDLCYFEICTVKVGMSPSPDQQLSFSVKVSAVSGVSLIRFTLPTTAQAALVGAQERSGNAVQNVTPFGCSREGFS